MKRAELQIEGMTCGHCVRSVDNALRAVPGVVVNRIAVGSAEVAYDESVASPEVITAAVQEEGYAVRGFEGEP